jgi:hypothetical protein
MKSYEKRHDIWYVLCNTRFDGNIGHFGRKEPLRGKGCLKRKNDGKEKAV